jgi:hypothetical protein
MIRKFYLLFLCTAFFICSSAVTASASYFYNNLTTTPIYDNVTAGYGVAGGAVPTVPAGGQSIANQFTSSVTGNVTQIDVALSYANTFSPLAYVSIYSTSGTAPGTLLYQSDNFSVGQQWGSTSYGLVTITGMTNLNLTAGSQYFIAVNWGDPNTDLHWYDNGIATPANYVTGQSYVSYNGGTTWSLLSSNQRLAAFDIVGTPVPIPAAVWLLGSGLIGLIGIRRFRK